MEVFTLEIVTPERMAYQGEALLVTVPSVEGEFGVLKHHAPLIAALTYGLIKIDAGNSSAHSIFIDGGFAEVTKDRCTILATEAFDLAKVNKEDIQTNLEAAEKKLKKSEEGSLNHKKYTRKAEYLKQLLQLL